MSAINDTCPYCGIYVRLEQIGVCRNHHIFGCPNCHKLTLFVIEADKIIDQYPKLVTKLEECVPKNVRDDVEEAIRTFGVNAFKSTVVMCRRALQSSVIGEGATKSKKLHEQIEELANAGIITKDLKDWAHEIRLTGNIGAHPKEDGLDAIGIKDAESILDFTEEYLNYVYVMPHKVKERRAKKKEKSK